MFKSYGMQHKKSLVWKLLALAACTILLCGAAPIAQGAAYANWTNAGDAATANVDYAVDADGNYTVYTALGLAKIANIVNDKNNLSGKSVTLANDIDLAEAGVQGYGASTVTTANSWNAIGKDSSVPFAGVFEGNGKTISNLYVFSQNTYAGLFGYHTGTIRDLEVASGHVHTQNTASSNTGGIVGYSRGLIENCVNRAAVSITGNGDKMAAGGIAGRIAASSNARISGCTNYGSITASTASNPYCGGIAGYLYDNNNTTYRIVVDGCSNLGDVTTDCTDSGTAYSGGIIGFLYGRTSSSSSEAVLQNSNSRLLNCCNYGKIISKVGHAGGIAAYSETCFIQNCFNRGAVAGGTSSASSAGGIIGSTYSYKHLYIQNCYNTGAVTLDYVDTIWPSKCGGVFGYINQNVAAPDHDYCLTGAAEKILGRRDKTKSQTEEDYQKTLPFESEFFSSDGSGRHRLDQAVYKNTDYQTTDLLTALNAWVEQNQNADYPYLTWIAEKDGQRYPIFGASNPPVVSSPESNQTITIYEGETASMSIIAEHAAAYAWKVSRDNGASWNTIPNADGSAYATGPAALHQSGWLYQCVVSGENGETVEGPVFTLIVLKRVQPPRWRSFFAPPQNRRLCSYRAVGNAVRSQLRLPDRALPAQQEENNHLNYCFP